MLSIPASSPSAYPLLDRRRAGFHTGFQHSPDASARYHANHYQRNAPTSLRPLHDRVIVKRLDQETKTASGIVLPDSAAEKPDQGEVIAVGPGRRDNDGKRIEPDLQVGDRVLFGKYAGQTVKVGSKELLVLREEDVVAVVNV